MTEETKPMEQSGEATPGAPTKAATPATAQSPGRFEALVRRWLDARTVLYVTGGVITLLLLLVAGTYLWNVFTVRGLQQKMASEREQLSAEQRKAMDLQARELLRLAARPLAWAVRAEMLRGNLGQVDDYMREFVRERGVHSILLVGPEGKILLATNRKLETQSAEGLVSKPLLAAAEPTFEEAGGMIRLAVPVAGFDRRLGLLVLDYDPAAK